MLIGQNIANVEIVIVILAYVREQHAINVITVIITTRYVALAGIALLTVHVVAVVAEANLAEANPVEAPEEAIQHANIVMEKV